jgi:hypothetical protein
MVELGYLINTISMKTHKLMIKTHLDSGLKYLCYTTTCGVIYDNYKGSGVLWKKHLKKYGDNIKTELIFETTDKDEFKKVATEKSIEYNIVNSDVWANLKIEEGDGGDTVSNKFWITDGNTDKYINKDLPLPDGWKRGRSNCVFNDSNKQKEFNKRVDLEKRVASMKAAWDSGKFDKRDHTKCGLSGLSNPACRPEVRKKISEAALLQSSERSERMKRMMSSLPECECPYCKKIGKGHNMNRWHFENCKYKNNV